MRPLQVKTTVFSVVLLVLSVAHILGRYRDCVLFVAGQTEWQPSLRLAQSPSCFITERSSPWWAWTTHLPYTNYMDSQTSKALI